MERNFVGNERGRNEPTREDVARNEVLVAPVASPAPLGLNLIAFMTGILGCYYANFIVHYGVPSEQAAIGVVSFIAGIALVLAGMWEFRKNYMITATLFTGYGAFLSAIGLIFMSALFGTLIATGTLHVTMGLIFLAWTIFNGIVWVGTFRTNAALTTSVGFLFITYILLTIGQLAGPNIDMLHIGGWLGVVCALVTWLAALVTIMSGVSPQGAFRLPIGRRIAAIE
jgi:succinate-acetate transporter protein